MTNNDLSEVEWLRGRVRAKRFDERLSFRAAAEQIGNLTGQGLYLFESGKGGLKAQTMLALLRWLEVRNPPVYNSRSSHKPLRRGALQDILELIYNDEALAPGDALVMAEVVEQLYRSLLKRDGSFP